LVVAALEVYPVHHLSQHFLPLLQCVNIVVGELQSGIVVSDDKT
jgi:hypothetical protein